ncbi:IPT/TIG domain-containing protein [Bacteroides sp. 224]|uniref:IPT/TIG domain-containing protein n=1 Tax=Bacteroides sp. 224 TaxID=2302936 RepID=UPI0013D7D758|nr:IPT/TIG domain-containing protein [Bacteroides sp. 224]NDV66584.1 hypothetical protein [Bacteroides sp. 224]
MRKKDLKKISQRTLVVLMCMAAVFFTGCDGSDIAEKVQRPDVPHDPSQPVVINSFEPKTGGVGTQILFKGSNFGSNPDAIKITMYGLELNVISASGDMVYAILPQDQPELDENDAEQGIITIKVGKGENMKEAKTTDKFKYAITPFVSTLCGFIDEKGKSSSIDGPINEAQFSDPNWLTFDQHKNLYVLEEEYGIRFIDKNHTNVTTVSGKVNGFGRFRTASFSTDWKYLYVTNDGGSWNDLGTAKFTIPDNFQGENLSFDRAINSQQCNGGAVHPQDNIYFFNSYEQGQVFKWSGVSNPVGAKENSKELFKIQDVRWEFNIQFHPSGDFAYIVVINRHYILKSYYNRETQELSQPVLFAGYPDQKGHRDGVATAARFEEPYQGAFDEEGNFYVCDRINHCIRKITPEGIVSTFAGRPGSHGYVDGELRDAQFDRPNGIVYDKDEKVFYVADRSNKRIRKITMPK